jgi:hypothetical protein
MNASGIPMKVAGTWIDSDGDVMEVDDAFDGAAEIRLWEFCEFDGTYNEAALEALSVRLRGKVDNMYWMLKVEPMDMVQDIVAIAMDLAYFTGLNAAEAVAGGIDQFIHGFADTAEGESTHVEIGQSDHWEE